MGLEGSIRPGRGKEIQCVVTHVKNEGKMNPLGVIGKGAGKKKFKNRELLYLFTHPVAFLLMGNFLPQARIRDL
jgi:hypothetical protein